MKRITFLIFLLVIIYSESIAQFSIGVQGGASASFISFKTKYYLNGVAVGDRLAINNAPVIAPIGGLTVNVHHDKRFSLQSEIIFENKEPGLWGHQYFIHFPEMIRFNIPVKPKSDKSFFIEAGPYFSYCVSKSFHDGIVGNCNYVTVGNYTYITPIITSNYVYTPEPETIYISKTDIGVATGIGYKQRWGIGQIDFCVKFEHTVSGQILTMDQVDIEGQNFDASSKLRHKILSFTVNYSLPVKTIKKLLHPVKQHLEKK